MNHLSQFENFRPNIDVHTIIDRIQSVLSDDLLTTYWKERLEKEDHDPTAGHCYAAAEALYHFLGGKHSHYIPHVGKIDEDGTHWWLQDKNGNILDPTADQFYYKKESPPYDKGRGTGFLTKLPSKRAQTIIDRVNSINNNL